MNAQFDWVYSGQQIHMHRIRSVPTPLANYLLTSGGSLRVASSSTSSCDSMDTSGSADMGLLPDFDCTAEACGRKFPSPVSHHQFHATACEPAHLSRNALSVTKPKVVTSLSAKVPVPRLAAGEGPADVMSRILATSVQAGLNELFGPPSGLALTRIAAPLSGITSVYEVKFKRNTKDYIRHSRVTTPISVGDLVVVQAERGCEDLGCVTRIRSVVEFMAERLFPAVSVDGKPFNVNKHTGKIVRLATTREQRMLGMKETDEEDVRRYSQHIAMNTFRLSITITDVDFQFDRRKVTVYYSTAQAQQRVDFRDLVAHLSDVYKTRVWMVCL